jgi:hypothetical protein
LVFRSAGRLGGDSKDHLFIVRREAEGWGTVVPIRSDRDDKNACSTDDEPHLALDHRPLYFRSDRVIPMHVARSPEGMSLHRISCPLLSLIGGMKSHE